MSDDLGYLAQLSPESRSALFEKLRGAAGPTDPRDPADPAEDPASAADPHAGSGTVPATPAQEQLWFLDQLVPNLPNYIVPFCFTLDGPLDADALVSAFGQVVRRHDALRTALRLVDGQLVQSVSDEGPAAPVPVVDLSGYPDPEHEGRRRCLIAARQPFDLATAPLWRCELLRLDEAGRRHMLVLVASHLVADGWSVGVIIRDLAAAYGADRPDTDRPRRQLADFAAWQREHLTESRTESLLDFWRDELAGLRPLDFPYDHPRPAAPALRGRSHFFSVDSELQADLLAASATHGVTSFMIGLAAYQVLLAEACGHPDIAVGTPVSGRDLPEFEQVVGSLVNTIVLRTDLRGDPTLEDVIHRVREVSLRAYAHQDLPFGQLVHELAPRRDMRFNPMCQTVFSFGSTPFTQQDVALGDDVRLGYFGIPNGTMRFDFELTLDQVPDGLQGRLEHNVDLMDLDTAERIADRYVELLEAAVRRPGTRLSELGIRPAAPDVTSDPVPDPPATETTDATESSEHTADPATVQQLQGLWAEALELDQVEPDDDFFVLGGSSMVATRLVVRIRDELDCELSLPAFFENCTVSELARLIDTGPPSGSAAIDVSLLERIEQMPDDEVEALLARLGTSPS